MSEPRVVVVGYDEAGLLDIACVTSTFDFAGRLGASPAYNVSVASPGGRPFVCQSGLTLQADHALERCVGPIDILVVSGGAGHESAAADQRLVGHVRRLAKESRRVASVCTGASILAAAGLLDGKRATTHWNFADQLAADHPRVTVDPDPIFIQDGNVFTAAGVTSALDLSLAFVEADHGADLARWVARAMVTYLQRPGNQAQMSMHVAAPPPQDDVVRAVVGWISTHLDGDLSTAKLAADAGVSERHLTRLFVEHLHQAPGRYVRRVRVEASAHLLTSTALPMPRIAARCGFRSAETLRQAFVACYGVAPSLYRATQVAHRRLAEARLTSPASAGA